MIEEAAFRDSAWAATRLQRQIPDAVMDDYRFRGVEDLGAGIANGRG